VVAVARRIDCDDVLFATSNPAMPLAVVHLTWTGHMSFNPRTPYTTGYMNWQDWNEQCLLPDHREFCRDGSSERRAFERRQAVAGAFDRRKSLQELEQDDWGESSHASPLVTEVHQLRRTPLAEFTVDDLGTMIGQQIGLPFLIPIALERLEVDPLAAEEIFLGYLLGAVFVAGEEYWSNHEDSRQRFREVIRRARELLPSLDEEDRHFVLEVLGKTPPPLDE
jgi:hypothetical protein